MVCRRKGNSVTPTWFGFALQALVILSSSRTVCSSCMIAHKIKAGVSFMRRIMAPLVQARIVEAREGRDGGYLLAKPAGQITLAEVYSALKIVDPLSFGLLDSTPDNPHGRSLQAAFQEITMKSEQSLLRVLGEYTVEDLQKRSIPLHMFG